MNSHEFDREAWAKLSVFEQMGNIGSEVGRAFKAKREGRDDRMQAAFYRGLDLIDVSAQAWASEKSPKLKELLRARELFAQAMTTDQPDPKLETYFMQFAIAARR